MAVFGAPVAYGDDPERAVRAAMAVRDSIADMDRGRSAVGAPGPGGGEHRGGDRGVERPSGRRRGDGRRRRREHGGPVAVQRAGERGARRPGDVRVHPDGDRVPAGRTDRREGQDRPGPSVGRRRAARRGRGAGLLGGADRRARRGAGDPPEPLGHGVVRAPMLVGDGVRACRDREVAPRARTRTPGRRRRAGSRSGAVPPGTATPARTARSRSTLRRSPGSTTATTPADGDRRSCARRPRRWRSPTIPARSPTPSRSWPGCPIEKGPADRESAVLLGAILRRGGRA